MTAGKARPARKGPVRARNPDATRRKLLDAGTIEFARNGYDGTSLEAIATRARVNKAMVSYHFKNKRGLYQAILDATVGEVVDRVAERLPADGTAAERLEAYIETLSEALAARPDFSAMLMREYLSGWFARDKALVARLATLSDMTRRLLQDGVRQKAFRAVDAHSFHLSIIGALTFFQASQRFRTDAAAHGTLELPVPSVRKFTAQLVKVSIAGLAVSR